MEDTYKPAQLHSETSVEAMESIKESASTLRAKVLIFIQQNGPHGATDDEIQRGIGMIHQTQTARRVELMHRGLIVDSGRKRKTSSNRKATVWVLEQYAPNVTPQTSMKWSLDQLGLKTLDEYYASEHWRNRRLAWWTKHPDAKCVVSGELADELHHLSYVNLGHECDEQLVPVTEECHKLIHDLVRDFRVPLDKAHAVAAKFAKNFICGERLDQHKGWTIPAEVMQQVLDRLPDDWDLTIRLQGGSIRPYLILTDDDGDGMWDNDGPLDGESVVDCISRLMRLVPEGGGDDE